LTYTSEALDNVHVSNILTHFKYITNVLLVS